MIKSPFGVVLTAAAALLALSPEARKGARRLAVKGAEFVLDMADQIKDRPAALQLTNSPEDERQQKETHS